MARLIEGATYREVAREFGVTLSTINRIAEDERKRTPDFDELRDLAVTLKKHGLTVFDTKRACELHYKLNMLGISLSEMEDYVSLIEKPLGKNLEPNFVTYALEFMQLSLKHGKSYPELVQDFKRTAEETTRLKREETASLECLQETKSALKKTKTELRQTKSELEEATTAQIGIRKIGIAKLASLAKLIEQCESVGYDAREIEKLFKWRQELQKFGIDPNKLGPWIAEQGTLENQNAQLKFANERLKVENKSLSNQNETLIQRNDILQTIDDVLRKNNLYARCKACGATLQIPLRTKEDYQDMLKKNTCIPVWCQRCGWQYFPAWEIISEIAWLIVPRSEFIEIQM